ncbi:sodium- and chloride-dependent betaine transporter-like [Exaiptasia diaphana]|uniref:Transporter n=1 Tax=Exaiptasia diaphana TaxID=2652724 RepID=A0A913X8H9_EXADI|nr:sodium- and chloride-dependent betaine transporter-like [Exaiptasia diaphana]
MTSLDADNNTNHDKSLLTKTQEVEVEVITQPRQRWDSKIEFILATLGYIVGYGNFWRFPYLCYRNGGASFIFPYFLMLAIIGVPMFFMELSVGQWYNRGFIGIWKAVCPLSSGIGYAMLFMQFTSNMYYIVILAWVFFYLFDSFRSEVPWKYCTNEWNTPFCRSDRIANQALNCTAFDLPINCTQKFVSPSSEYWTNRVLHITKSINDMGDMRWELAGTLLFSWVVVYFCIFKTIKLTGKIVYFTAIFPLVIIFVMLIRGVTLDGVSEGILYYLKPDFARLADPQVWVFAATQIYWSLGTGFGGVMTFGSFNTFRNNVHGDALLISISNSVTSFVAGFAVFSVLGFMAYTLKSTVANVASSGPGLVFIVYPEAISQMPLSVFWSILFFFMLVTLGLDTMFGSIESVVTAIVDEKPQLLRHRKWLVLLVVSVVLFFFGLMNVMEGGMYIFNLFDYQTAAINLLLVVLLENIFISWIYGIDRFSQDIEAMTGRKPYLFIKISLKWITPFVSAAILLANVIKWNGIKYNGVAYPAWAEMIGWFLCLTPIFIILGVSVHIIWKTPGSLKERWAIVTRPDQQVLKEIEEKHNIKRSNVCFL